MTTNKKIVSEVGLTRMAESLDKLMTVDIAARGSIHILYDAARKRLGKPLTLGVVEKLREAIKPQDYVILASGWADQPWNLLKSESDGPAGIMALARTIRVTLKGLPILLTDSYIVDDMKQVAMAAGFHCVEPGELKNSLINKGFDYIPSIAIMPFPLGEEEGKAEAVKIIEKWNPSACIAAERGDMSGENLGIHGSSGVDYTDFVAKVGHLFKYAKEKGILTIGIGDGGNEIGMANIAETIIEKIKNAEKMVATTEVDILVAATISNWGAYAISDLLAASTGDLEHLCNDVIEERVLAKTRDVGFHDPMKGLSGLSIASVDGCETKISLAIINLMREVVLQGYLRY